MDAKTILATSALLSVRSIAAELQDRPVAAGVPVAKFTSAERVQALTSDAVSESDPFLFAYDATITHQHWRARFTSAKGERFEVRR